VRRRLEAKQSLWRASAFPTASREAIQANSVGFWRSLESNLVEKGVKEPGSDLRPPIWIGSTPRPEDVAPNLDKAGSALDDSLDALVLDVAEDATEQEHVHREHVDEGLDCAGVSAANLYFRESGCRRCIPRPFRKTPVGLHEDRMPSMGLVTPENADDITAVSTAEAQDGGRGTHRVHGGP
jgi:hypothetical protein